MCDAINDGFPLCCVVSTDNFIKHNHDVYKKSILISPVPENPDVLKQLVSFAKYGIKTLMYGTNDKLQTVKDFDGLVKFDVEKREKNIREILSQLGYHISFTKKEQGTKPPTMCISRHDNALLFSVYNCNTTTDAHFKFPFGAPILCGCETEMVDGKSTYRFTRGEHRECRVFAEQESGIISCREAPPVNARYRRAIHITGLKDATICLFTEKNVLCLQNLPIIHLNLILALHLLGIRLMVTI